MTLACVAMRICAALVAAGAGVSAAASAEAARVCVIVPHFKDEYWLSVGYGLQRAANETGAELLIHESGGYLALERQIALLKHCRETPSDAVLLGAVSADDPRLLAAVAETVREQPVLALVNALDAPGLAARVGVDWHGMGRAVGAYLAHKHPAGSPPVTAVLVTGPVESGWGPILDAGLAEGLAGSAVRIVASYRADTGLREQLREVERVFSEHPEADYLIGSAPAIEGAMALLRRLPEGTHRPALVATYISHSVLRGMKTGQVEMVPFDDPIAQGRLGLELALGSVAGEIVPGLSGPEILPVTATTGNAGSIALSPAGFFPDLQ
ncbi:MAG: TMAO reductase system periplasmic protein TorT [Rhodobacterales bacterium]|nr:MAG: TMAO reductase system periplasmic protein TorT [Rhodobacterales bacterium]